MSSGRATRRPSGFVKSAAGSSLGAQDAQRPQHTQTRIFAMIVDEPQANPDSVTGIISIFGELAWFCLILGLVGHLLAPYLHYMLIES